MDLLPLRVFLLIPPSLDSARGLLRTFIFVLLLRTFGVRSLRLCCTLVHANLQRLRTGRADFSS